MISQLEQSLYNHQQWYNALIRTLICSLPPDRHDLSKEAWKECRFGQWYYFEVFETLKRYQGFIALGEAHKRMHVVVQELLEDLENGRQISTMKYDQFSNSLDQLRLEISSLKNELEDLLYNRDPLTNLLNRVNILPILREFHEIAKRGKHSYCLVMVDLDKFKEVNDTHGHVAGDTVLSATARFIVKNLRSYDKVFRYGGEEFLFVLQDIELQKAFEQIEALRQAFKRFSIPLEDNKEIQLTASFGITLLNPFSPIETSIENADQALYLAKREGGDKVQIWEDSFLKKTA